MKVIVIGGVAAGMSAASKLKRLVKNVEIVVYEKGEVLSYGACGMPYFISDEIKDANRLVARTKEKFEESGIKVNIFHEVIEVNDSLNQVTVKDLTNNTIITDNYDYLIVGSGASPRKLNIEGENLGNIFNLNSFEDGINIKEQALKDEVKDIVIVGGGFIGIELVEAFKHLNKNVTLIEHSDHILSIFDEDITVPLENHLRDKNVILKLGESATRFIGNTNVTKVVTKNGEYKADLVVVAIGITPNTSFLTKSNVILSTNKAVEVNRTMQTNISNIYAAGDCSMIFHKVLYKTVYLPMGHNANKQGRIVAENIAGINTKLNGVLGTTVIKVIDMEAAKTGLTEKEAKLNNIDYGTEIITGRNHAGYYPNATKVTIKVIYDKTTKMLLGAEMVGYKDTAIRINIFALAIHNKMTSRELGFTDLAYAPPFAGVWDVTQVAANKIK
ncbi:MAG: CoA-disulfide reductase [Candidatus Izemoplasma sp.]